MFLSLFLICLIREGFDQLFVTKLKQFTAGRPGKQWNKINH